MISKPITFIMDEQTNVALYLDKYVVFEEDKFSCISPADAVEKYMSAHIRIPPEFTAIRQALQEKIAVLNSLM